MISQSRPVTVSRIQAHDRLPLRPVNPPVTRSLPRRGGSPSPRRPARGRAKRGPISERQRRLRQRALPLAIVAVAAFIFGAISAAGSPEQDMAKRFVEAWANQDFKAM